MKEGTGADPFEEDAGEQDESAANSPSDSLDEESGSSVQSDVQTGSPSSDQSEADRTQSPSETTIPYKFRRSDVQEGRTRLPLFYHDETAEMERDVKTELESRFGESISKADLREALIKAGMDNLDDVETHLEHWGYGMTFDQ